MLDPFLEALPNAKPYVFEAFPESADAFEQAIRAGFDGGDFAAMMDSAQQMLRRVSGSFKLVFNAAGSHTTLLL